MFCDRKQIRLLRELLEEVRELRNELFPSKLTVNFESGDIKYMNDVTLTLTPPQTTTGTVTGIYKGQPYAPAPANLVWSVQTSGVVNLVQNADGSATFTPVAVGSTQVGVVDSSNQLSGTGTITVAAGPDGLTISFSSPV
jgi:hypothetical protein